ncbi:MAG TPA: helix-turn-helix domain-containing protein [Stellaceae bacterium]|nr:helix-turn-helix domain-containing protein [Stellaceae bacterium]
MAKRTKQAKPRAATPRDRILDAALDLAGRSGWRNASLGAIAGEAGMPIGEVYGEFRSRAAIVRGLMSRTDAEVLATPTDADETPRDRLFDILMRRFDQLKPHRASLRSIARDLLADPPAALCSAPALLRSMAWMLEAAGVGTTGLCGRLRVRALVLLYLSVMRVFLADESEDLARTMAALDRRLRQAAPWLGLAAGPSDSGRGAEKAAS